MHPGLRAWHVVRAIAEEHQLAWPLSSLTPCPGRNPGSASPEDLESSEASPPLMWARGQASSSVRPVSGQTFGCAVKLWRSLPRNVKRPLVSSDGRQISQGLEPSSRHNRRPAWNTIAS